VFIAASALYAMTASRTIGWQDSGQFVLRVVRGELANPLGLALTHPLYFWICRTCVALLPIEPPVLLPLIAAMLGATAVANVYGIVKTVTRRTVPAVLAAGSLAVAHTFWRMTTQAKGIDPMAAALLTFELWSLIQWDRTRRPVWLIVMFLLNGLGLASLNMALLTLPVIGIVLILAVSSGEAGWAMFLISGLSWLVGSSAFTGYVAYVAWTSGDVIGTIRSALFGNYSSAVLGQHFQLGFTLTSLAFTILSFPNLTLPAALLGIVRGRRAGVPKLTYVALLSALAIHLLFVLRYQIIDQYTFLLPAYSMIAILAGVGFAAVEVQFPANAGSAILAVAAVAIGLTPILYLVVPATARHFHVLGAQANHKPYRDDYRYLFSPWGRGEDSANRMSREAVNLAGQGGYIIAEDAMGEFAIDYQIAHRNLRNVEVLHSADPIVIMAAAKSGRHVVLVTPSIETPPAPPPLGRWQRVGDLYVLQD